MDISIVVVALNEGTRLPFLLSCIDAQDDLSWIRDLILIDNGSSDDTLAIMKDYGAKHDFVEVRIYHGALGGARMLGSRLAKGQYLAFLDADMGILPNWLSSVRSLLLRHENRCDAIVAKILPLRRFRGPLDDYVAAYALGDTTPEGPWLQPTFHSGGLVVKTELVNKVGFNVTMTSAEDGDFSRRFIGAGYRACYFPLQSYVFDEQYYDVRGFLSYFRKLGTSGVILLKSSRDRKMASTLLKTLAEPVLPHYIVTRRRASSRLTRVGYGAWLLYGMVRIFAMSASIFCYGALGFPLPKKTQRLKR